MIETETPKNPYAVATSSTRPVIVSRGALSLPGFRNLYTGGVTTREYGAHHEATYMRHGFTVSDPRKREGHVWHRAL